MSPDSDGTMMNQASNTVSPGTNTLTVPAMNVNTHDQVVSQGNNGVASCEPAVTSNRQEVTRTSTEKPAARRPRRKNMLKELGSEDEVLKARMVATENEDIFEKKDGTYSAIRRSTRRHAIAATERTSVLYATGRSQPPATRRRRKVATRRAKAVQTQTSATPAARVFEKITDDRVINGVSQLQVKWVGVPEDQSTWEDGASLADYAQEVYNYFHARYYPSN
ncbi:uncharacterized protein F4807DRAFT_277317 [Annulohypoxylon truncatum]|uniref:uncharacterized protein n=1 Tax=Annulohypoxylon truncatum TaxID=327061 RepID=UPI002007DE5D|nr:uncharacterized protein F4807DRAFT_277317 [Annulohypoxylon truncatum]KAI1205610.1 hypothetical protein F4807DRAFT_277317 [Annulohypoxylon truncatum]